MKKRFIYLLVLVVLVSCSKKLFSEKWTKQEAPEEFKARFETTQGNFDIISKREWSPEGVDRLYTLIKRGFYDDIAVFRVVPNFVAQFGIHDNDEVNKSWDSYKLNDEPVVLKNDSLTISFARGGRRTRGTQIFINLKDNNRLDDISSGGVVGFPAIAKITSGMDNVLKFYGKYGDKLGRRQDSIHKYGNAFIRKNYPEIDFIKKAYIIK